MNPFAFLSETTLRFVLLIVFALCGSASLYSTIWEASHRAVEREVDACTADLLTPTASPGGLERIGANPAETVAQISTCAVRLRPRAKWQLAGSVLTAIIAGLVYRFLPPLILRARRLVTLHASDAPGLLDEVQDLCRVAGLKTVPNLVWNPVARSTPHVFGAGRECYCALSGAFVVTLYRDKPLFRTILLHELAHIRSGDVAKTYLATATVAAFVLTAALPATASVIFAGPTWSDLVDLLLKLGLSSALLCLAGASVLRAREYYADVQTSVWEGTPSTLMRILADPPGAGRGWRRLLDVHPAPGQRRASIADPSLLLRLTAWDAFAVGLTAWLIIGVLRDLMSAFLPGDLWSMALFQLSASLALPAIGLALAVGAVGIGVWRGAFAALVLGRNPARGTGRLGLALGASSLLPAGLTLLRAVASESRMPFAVNLDLIAFDIWIGVGVTCACFLVFRWIVDATSAWLGVVLRNPSPVPVLAATILAVLVLVVGSVGSASFAVYFYRVAGFQPSEASIFDAVLLAGQVVGFPALVATVVAFGFPLSARLWLRPAIRRQPAGWVFLDGAEPPRLPAPWPVAAAVTAGLAMGLGSCLLFELIYFARYLPPWLDQPISAGFSSFTAWNARILGNPGAAMPAATGLFQVAAASIAACAARSLSATSGLLAAFVVGSVAALFNVLFFPDPNKSIYQTLITPVMLLAIGTLLAFPFSVGIAWIKSALTTPAHRNSVDPAPSRPRPASAWLARSVVASLCVAVAFGVTMRLRDIAQAERETQAVFAQANSGDARAQVRLAMMYLSGKSVGQDQTQAAAWMRNAADKADPEAMFRLAVLYFRGWGVPQDAALASQWMLRSAETGYPDAVRQLAALYASGQAALDPGLALPVLRHAAETGNAEAQNTLGLAYRLGRGIEQDDRKAVEWFRLAADQGHATAMTNLGWMYQQGLGAAQDKAAAFALFSKAANLGLAEAQYLLGQMLEAQGDDAQVVLWLRKAAAQGHMPALQRLRELCERGVQPACG